MIINNKDPFYAALEELFNKINIEIDFYKGEGPPVGEFLVLGVQFRLDLIFTTISR